MTKLRASGWTPIGLGIVIGLAITALAFEERHLEHVFQYSFHVNIVGQIMVACGQIGVIALIIGLTRLNRGGRWAIPGVVILNMIPALIGTIVSEFPFLPILGFGAHSFLVAYPFAALANVWLVASIVALVGTIKHPTPQAHLSRMPDAKL